jgi:C4-type Zn-finger protein
MNRLKKSVAVLFVIAGLCLATGVIAQEQSAPAAVQAPQQENNAPSVNGIPGESILEGKNFAPIKLDDFVTDPEDKAATLRWQVSGNKNLQVTISNRVVNIKAPTPYWNGSEDITFTATDPKGASGSETVTFTIESVNNPPEVTKIPDQSIDEGKKFTVIKLDDYVSDPDHPKDQIVWETEITPSGKDAAEGEITVEISKDRIATIVIPDTNWYGAAKIKFTATDGEFASAKTEAVFTVRSINDPPIVQKAPDQTIDEKNTFETISLADLVSDADDDPSKIKWTVSGGDQLKITLDKYNVATVKIPNENWNGPTETFTFTATDPQGASSSFKTNFTVKSINDAPEFIAQIPEQTINEKQQFKNISLDKYIKDIDNPFEQLKWDITGGKDIKIEVIGKEAKIILPSLLWNGSETFNFKVTDPAGAVAETQTSFTVNSVNDVPKIVKQIPSQAIDEKKKFAPIKLDEFVSDADNKAQELSWEVNVEHQGKMPESGTLTVNIDEKHVATIEIPDSLWNGAVNAKFKVTDPEGASDVQEVKFTVKSINDLPVFKKIADQTVDEKTEFNSFSLDDVLSDADHDISKLKVSVSGQKDLKVNINEKTREVSIKAPNLNWNGSEIITFTAVDPEGGSASTTAKFTIKSINDPPVMTEIKGQTIKEKQTFKAIELDSYVTDIDHEKSQLKWTVSGNKDIKITIDAEHRATLALPTPYWNGAETVTFKVTDPAGASDEKTVDFTVESINDAPEFIKEVADQTIDEKKSFAQIKLGEMVKDPDNKAESLVWSFDVKPVAGAPKGTLAGLQVNMDAKQVATIVIPDKYWNGSDEIKFTVTDPEGAKATSTAIFTVNSINDVPTLKEIASQAIDEKQQFAPVNLAELASDPDHSFDKLKWTFSGNKDLKISLDKAGVLTVSTPNNLWNGSEKITITVEDPEGASAKQVVTFTVKSINDPPVMKDIPAQTIKEKQQFKTVELDDFVSDLDDEDGKLKWTVSGNKDLKVSIDAKHIMTVGIPDKGWHGSETLKIDVADNAGAMDSRSVAFTVESVNDVPAFTKKINDQTINEKSLFNTIKLSDFIEDPDNKIEDLAWSFDVKPAPGTPKGYQVALQVNVDAKQIATVVIPNKNWHGSELITFTATDPEGAKASTSALFTVNSVNDTPIFKKINDQSILEKETFAVFNLAELVDDPDDAFSSLKWTITGTNDLKVNITKSGDASIQIPNKFWNGTEKITFMVTDPEGASAKQTVTYSVKSINDPPVMKDIPSQTIKEKQQFKSINLDNFVEDLDHPKEKLKWVVSDNKALKVSLDGSHNATITTPDIFWHGSETIKFAVTDPEGATDSRAVVFTVESVNDAPEFVKEIADQTIDEKKNFVSIKLDDYIKDADHKKSELKWTWDASSISATAPVEQTNKKNKKGKAVEPPAKATSALKVEIDNNRVATIQIPDKYWNGAAKITFTATDPEGAKASASAKFTVRSVNDLPQISDKAPTGETVRENGIFKTIDLSTLATDADNSATSLVWTITGNKDLKVIKNKDNTITVAVPDAQWFGKEVLTFTVVDPDGGKASQKMTFEVTEVNDAPTLSAIPGQKIKEKAKFNAVKLDDYVKDPDDKPNTLVWSVTGAKQLKAEISPNHQLVVTAPNEYFWCTPETLTLIVKDKGGALASTTVTYEITSVNDAPEVKDIPDQKIKEKSQFKDIQLDNYVSDPDHKKDQLTWTATILKKAEATAPTPKKKNGKKDKKVVEETPKVSLDDVSVEIDNNRVAHIKLASKFWNGERDITFTATDPEGAKSSKTAHFEVESVNDLPVMKTIESQTIKEKERFVPIDLAGIASDPDHAASKLSFEVSNTRSLKASINSKQQLIVETPDKFWNGEEKITLTVTDPEDGKAVQQILFTVLSVNDAPVISKIDGQTIKEQSKFEPVNLSTAATDPDNKPTELKWSVSGNKDLKVDIKGNRASIATPNPNWNGKEALTFTVTDPQGASASTKADFEVTPVNDPPVLKKAQPQVTEEKKTFESIDFAKLVSDPDNKLEELRWTLDNGLPATKDKKGKLVKGKPSSVKHALVFGINDKGLLTTEIPNEFWNGEDQVTVNVFDPSGEKASVDVKFVVKPVNDVPVITDIEGQQTTEGKSFKPIKLDNYVNDPDNKVHEMKWTVKGNQHLEVIITSGREALIRANRVDWFGKEELTFTVTDPSGAKASTKALFEIKHVNAVPELRNIPDFTIKEDENKGVVAVIKLDQYARDKDNSFDELKWTFSGNKNLELKYDKVRNELTIQQPRENWNGPTETITFKVTDPEGASAQMSAKFTVLAVNDAPSAMSQAYQTKEGEPLNVNADDGLMAGATDPDGEKPSEAVLVSKPQNGSVILNSRDGSFSYAPNKGFYGLDEFSFKLKDKGGLYSKPETAEINVNFKMKDVRGEEKKSDTKVDDQKSSKKKKK